MGACPIHLSPQKKYVFFRSSANLCLDFPSVLATHSFSLGVVILGPPLWGPFFSSIVCILIRGDKDESID